MSDNRPKERVFTVHGYPPQVVATAMAMHSRSPRTLDESLALVTEDKAGAFFDKFVGGYGHASVADMAHFVISMQGITQMEAFALWVERVADGQEQSTRYQPFDQADCWVIPPEIRGSGTEAVALATELGRYMLDRYRFYAESAESFLRRERPRPDDIKESQYESTIRARAFDVARYWLFNGIRTTVSQVMSVRTFERTVRRMWASPYQLTRDLAIKMMQAALEELPLMPEGMELEQPVASGLAKYLEADQFAMALSREAGRLANLVQLQSPVVTAYGPDVRYHSLVKLANRYSQVRLHAALLLYEHSNLPLERIMGVIGDIKAGQIVRTLLQLRGNHDPMPSSLAADRGHLVEIVMDTGGLRDLHRHRACIQLHQPLTTSHDWAIPDMVRSMGLAEQWSTEMGELFGRIGQLPDQCGVGAHYLYPFGLLRRSLFAMDLAQLEYMTKLRTTPQGHPSYRWVAAEIARQCIEANPHLDGLLRYQPYVPDLENDIFRR